MTFDVLISHSTADKAVSNRLCERLEQAGLRCWIAPRNIAAGAEWTAAILDGINSSRVMVLVFSESADASRHVQREILYATENKMPILPFRIQHATPTGSLAYCLLGVQWLDAWEPAPEVHIDTLISRVRGILGDLDDPAVGRSAATAVGMHPVPKGNDVYFDCVECGRSMVIDAAAAGMAVDCIFCGKEVVVPGSVAGKVMGLDPAAVAKISVLLSNVLGPIASHLVKTTARRATTLYELGVQLAAHIPNQKERAAFLDAVGHHAGTQSAVSGRAAAVAGGAKSDHPAVSWQPEVLKRIKADFATYVGPVAGVLVERMAKETGTPRELYERLALNIPSQKERAAWLLSAAEFE